MRKIWGAVAASAILGAAGQACAAGASGTGGAVTVQGAGLAEQCSQAARDGSTAAADEQICTRSIAEELLPARDRAGTYVNRGVIRLRNKAYDLAIADFDTAIQYQSELAEAYADRGAAMIGK